MWICQTKSVPYFMCAKITSLHWISNIFFLTVKAQPSQQTYIYNTGSGKENDGSVTKPFSHIAHP